MSELSSEPRLASPLRRRPFLRGLALLGGLALLKGAGRAVVGVPAPEGPTAGGPWTALDERTATTVTHVALALHGERGREAFAGGRWRPADDVDRLLGALAADQRKALVGAIRLLEEWTPGWRGFSALDPEAQTRALEGWRTSRLAVRRSIWGFLHAATRSSYADSPAGWAHMGYPGPCRGDVGYPGRMPGQSVAFDWDPRVP